MKFYVFIFLYLISGIILFAQELKKVDVDSLVSLYNEQERYDSTSLVLVTYANQEQIKGNLELALEYQICNCELIEQHAAYFAEKGFTLKDLYNNYAMVLILQRDLNRSSEAIKTYLELAHIIKQFSPEELPFYADLIASTLGLCTEMPLADSIYSLQDALDIIKQQDVTNDNTKKYVWFCKCFYANRKFNSFKNINILNNKFAEIESWFSRNIDYVQLLDTSLYRKEILEYFFDYTDILYLYAGDVGIQKQNFLEAIRLLQKEIIVLSSIGIEDDLISLKIASCYARIANFYYLLGNNPLCKQYCDKTYHYIFNSSFAC